MKSAIKSLCVAIGATLVVGGSAYAEDLPWKFEGDTTRTGEVAEAAVPLTSFETWTKVADMSSWMLAGSFNSMAPGFLLFLR